MEDYLIPSRGGSRILERGGGALARILERGVVNAQCAHHRCVPFSPLFWSIKRGPRHVKILGECDDISPSLCVIPKIYVDRLYVDLWSY